MSITEISSFQGNSVANDFPSNRMDCSTDGQHIIVFAGKRDNRLLDKNLRSTSAPSQIWISNDGGTTFRNQTTFGTGGGFKNIEQVYYGNYRWLLCSVKCDSTGQYMLTDIHDSQNGYGSYFQYSNDYGATWEFLFNTSANNKTHTIEDFSISEPIEGGNPNFPCYITFEHRGQIWVWSPLTSTSTQSLSNIKVNDISMSDDGSKIIFAGRNQVCKYSTDYGVNWGDVPSLTKGACCSLLDNQMIVVDYDGTDKNIAYSNDSGANWTASQITLTENFHEASIGSNKIVLSGVGGKMYSSADGVVWTEENTGLTDTLNGLVAFNSGFYFLNSAVSGERTFYSFGALSGGGSSQEQSTPTIYYNTAPIVERFATSITDASSLSFTLPLPSDFKHYKLTLLHETAINANPVFVGDIFFNATEKVIVPVVSQKVLSQSVSDNVLTFTLDANYSGTFTLSVMRSS